jgi:translocation and assembly module TamB
MTNSPSPERPPEPPRRRLRLFLTSPTSITIGIILLTGIAGGAWWAWVWIHRELAPLVERNLQELLGRPVELGRVEGVSLSGLRFDSAAIPATQSDPDRVTVETVDVQFSLLKLLFNRTLQLNVTLIEPNIYVEQAKDGSWISTTIKAQEEAGFVTTDLQSIRFRDANLVLQPLPRRNVPTASVVLTQVDGVARFLDENQRITFDVGGSLARGGNVELKGETRPAAEQTNLSLQAQNILATDISRLVELPVDLQSGRINGNLTVQLRPEEAPELAGTVALNRVTAKAEAVPQSFANTQGVLQFQGKNIRFDNVNTQYGRVPAQVKGVINTETGYNLSVQVRSVTARNLLSTLQVNSPVPIQGTLRADLRVTGNLQQPVLSGNVRSLGTAQIDRVSFRSLRSQFQLATATTPPRIVFPQIQAVPQAGGEITGQGRVLLGDTPQVAFNFQANNVPGDTIARSYGAAPGITIGAVSATAQIAGATDNIRTVVNFRVPEATYPGRGQVVIANQGDILLRDAVFQVADGTVRANGRIANGQLLATVNADQVRLNQFSQDLRGRLSGNVQLSGSTNNLSLATLQAQGRVRLSQGISVIEEPLTAQFRWNGEQVQIQQATAPGLLASGTIAVQTEGATPQIGNLNLDVQAQGFDLQDFALNLPGNVALVGQADFNGRVTGTPTAPNAIGNLQLRNFRVNDLAFDPVLAGRLNFQGGRRTELNLVGQQVTGTQDQIALTLGANNLPTSFLIRRDQTIASGRTVGDTLLVDVQGFPVAVLRNLVPAGTLNVGPIAGDLSGNLAVNLNNFNVEGDVTVTNPRVGRIAGDVFRGRFRFANGAVSITEGELQQGESRIAFGGNVPLGGDRPIDFRLNLDDANIQNVLQTLSVFDFGDFATGLEAPNLASAAAVQPNSILLADDPIITQLRRLSEIEALIAQQQAATEAEPLPQLSELNGELDGSIIVSGSFQRGLNVTFDISGQDWQWDDYKIEQVIAQGRFANGTLTILPLRVEFDQGTLAFSGQVGTGQLTGQLRADRLPIGLFDPFLQNNAIDIDGQLDGIVTVAGSLDNPQAIGEIALVNGRLNNQTIQQANLNFRYINARLNFDSNALLAGTDPINVAGSVPIALPFAAVQPDSDRIQVRARVQNDGLALINTLTDQVTWVDGQGQLNATVTGTLRQPIIQGSLTVQDATLKAQVLADPLTNVTGAAEFNGDRIIVQSLQARYNEGQVAAQGILPIFPTQSALAQAATTPLTVSTNNLELNLQGLYQGNVAGNVVITGSALAPVIGGTVQLSNAQVLIGQDEAEAEPTTPTTEPTTTPEGGAETETTEEQSTIAFNNLRLILGNDVEVVRQPILSFKATGDLFLGGTLGDLRPQGVIRLTGGQINLFTTQFVLARGYEQTATFIPTAGLDPILDVRLVALVPETTGSRLPTSALSSEVVDNPIAESQISTFGTLRTIQVQARVTGPASELSENLELTSSPPRSEAEIVALLGGSFIATLGQADTAAGIANLAGSAVLGGFQGTITEIGQTLGLSELRVFPTIVTDPTSDASVLGLAVEAVRDITGNLSVSVSRVFAADDPFRYNLIYRVNDEILLRASTDLDGDNRASVEYEVRF